MIFPSYSSMETSARYLMEERNKEVERIRVYREQQLLLRACQPSPISAALATVRHALSRISAGLSRADTSGRALKQTPAAGAGQ